MALPTIPEAPVSFTIVVPEGAAPGTELTHTTPDGKELCLAVPPGVPPGSRLVMTLDPVTERWGCVVESPDVAASPEPAAPVSFSVTVPATAAPGSSLPFKTPDGRELDIVVPPGVSPGSVLTLTEDPVTGGWSCVAGEEPAAKPLSFSMTVPPEAAPGTTLHHTLPDGRVLDFGVPPGVPPGSVLTFTQDPTTKAWGCEVDSLGPSSPPSAKKPAPLGGWEAPSMSMVVPPDAQPGSTLTFTTPDGRSLDIAVPDGVYPGYVLTLAQDPSTKSWSCSAEAPGGGGSSPSTASGAAAAAATVQAEPPLSTTVVVPLDALPGSSLLCMTPDGKELDLVLPPGVPGGSTLRLNQDPVTLAWGCSVESMGPPSPTAAAALSPSASAAAAWRAERSPEEPPYYASPSSPLISESAEAAPATVSSAPSPCGRGASGGIFNFSGLLVTGPKPMSPPASPKDALLGRSVEAPGGFPVSPSIGSRALGGSGGMTPTATPTAAAVAIGSGTSPQGSSVVVPMGFGMGGGGGGSPSGGSLVPPVMSQGGSLVAPIGFPLSPTMSPTSHSHSATGAAGGGSFIAPAGTFPLSPSGQFRASPGQPFMFYPGNNPGQISPSGLPMSPTGAPSTNSAGSPIPRLSVGGGSPAGFPEVVPQSDETEMVQPPSSQPLSPGLAGAEQPAHQHAPPPQQQQLQLHRKPAPAPPSGPTSWLQSALGTVLGTEMGNYVTEQLQLPPGSLFGSSANASPSGAGGGSVSPSGLEKRPDTFVVAGPGQRQGRARETSSEADDIEDIPPDPTPQLPWQAFKQQPWLRPGDRARESSIVEEPPPPPPPRPQGGACQAPQSQVTVWYCQHHNSSAKRPKSDAGRVWECRGCMVEVNTNYKEFAYCQPCSHKEKRCMVCGEDASSSSQMLVKPREAEPQLQASSVPPRYCPMHGSSEKRTKVGSPKFWDCTSCGRQVTTNYSSFALCPPCSEKDMRCMICGSPALEAGRYVPPSTLNHACGSSAKPPSPEKGASDPSSPQAAFTMQAVLGTTAFMQPAFSEATPSMHTMQQAAASAAAAAAAQDAGEHVGSYTPAPLPELEQNARFTPLPSFEDSFAASAPQVPMLLTGLGMMPRAVGTGPFGGGSYGGSCGSSALGGLPAPSNPMLGGGPGPQQPWMQPPGPQQTWNFHAPLPFAGGASPGVGGGAGGAPFGYPPPLGTGGEANPIPTMCQHMAAPMAGAQPPGGGGAQGCSISTRPSPDQHQLLPQQLPQGYPQPGAPYMARGHAPPHGAYAPPGALGGMLPPGPPQLTVMGPGGPVPLGGPQGWPPKVMQVAPFGHAPHMQGVPTPQGVGMNLPTSQPRYGA